MKVGVFGGSFDPVHNGHLRVAEACRRAVPLDEVLFLPAATQPLKPQGPRALTADRMAMLELAVAGRDGLRVSDLEVARGGVSYTVDTLRQLAGAGPRDELFLIVGTDALSDLPNWRSPYEICSLATLLVVERPGTPTSERLSLGHPGEGDRFKEARLIRVPLEPLDISSSEIRGRIARGEPIDELVPAGIAEYIAERGLYQGSV
jgi:nicotinate-nucleotide adenylyltransferase